MTALRIKSTHSPDVDIDIWEPADGDIVHFLLQVEIGQTTDDRADVFQVVIATPEGLRAASPGGEVLSDRATIVLSEFSWEAVWRRIKEILSECEGQTWNESVLKLQRYLRWEYEDLVQEP